MLRDWMRSTSDPRATSDDDRWDKYPYYGGPAAAEPIRGADAGRTKEAREYAARLRALDGT